MQQIHSDDEQQLVCSVIPSSTIASYLKNAITNLAYNIKHFQYLNIPGIFREKIQFEQNGSEAYLLGKIYQKESIEEFNIHFQNTIWFSYRKNIPGIGDDTGWGCMIRSAMMMIAEALKRTGLFTISEILEHFQGKQPFSFISICKEGNFGNFQLKADKRWTTANQVMITCSKISNIHQQFKIKIINIPNSCLQLSEIQSLIIQEPKRSKLLVFQIQLGLQKFDPDFSYHLKQIMKSNYFCGFLGGVPGNAMFVIGFKDQNIIGLDPHYVQDEQNPNQFYFKQNPRGLNLTKISSCISIGFLIQNTNDLNHLIQYMLQLESRINSQYKVINLILSTEQKQHFQQLSKDFKQCSPRKQSDDFQLLQ